MNISKTFLKSEKVKKKNNIKGPIHEINVEKYNTIQKRTKILYKTTRSYKSLQTNSSALDENFSCTIADRGIDQGIQNKSDDM